MAFSNNNTIKQIIELKKENENLRQTINYLKMENFEYALKCSQIDNIISNIQAVTRNNTNKLLEGSQNMCGILEACGTGQAEASRTVGMIPEIMQHSYKKPPEETSIRYSNKAHVVKPHMVNGTILHTPTINLTRVSDLNLQSLAESNLQTDKRTSLESNAINHTVDTSDDADENEPSAAQDFSSENQLSTLREVSEASTSQSPAHSTVLSGNFHEVKIFLNPISQDVLNKQSRKDLNSQRRSSPADSPRNKYRSTEERDYVTRSRRIN